MHKYYHRQKDRRGSDGFPHAARMPHAHPHRGRREWVLRGVPVMEAMILTHIPHLHPRIPQWTHTRLTVVRLERRALSQFLG